MRDILIRLKERGALEDKNVEFYGRAKGKN